MKLTGGIRLSNCLQTVCIFILLVVVFDARAQLSAYGSEVSFSEIPTYKLSKNTVDSLIELSERVQDKMVWRFAVSVPLQVCSNEQGIWHKQQDGSWVWYCKIYSKGAFSLRPQIDKLELAAGGHLKVFTPSRSQIETLHDAQTPIEPLQGDMIILELCEPASEYHQSMVSIAAVLHDYKDFFSSFSKRGTAAACNIDINCNDGKDWQHEKRASCRILFGITNCTGTLVNNTAGDQTPYILTADHCIESATSPQTAIYYFHFESDSCGGTRSAIVDTIKGAILVSGPVNRGVDFALLRLHRPPMAKVRPFLAGWSVEDIAPKVGITVHHPRGDMTKISVSDSNIIATATFYQVPYTQKSASWLVKKWAKGTTEGGSSGAPLYDSKTHLIVGTLTGGDTDTKCIGACNDYFAKFSVNWNHYADSVNQIKPWLDPQNTGQTQCDGMEMTKVYVPPVTGQFEITDQVQIAPNPVKREQQLLIVFQKNHRSASVEVVDVLGAKCEISTVSQTSGFAVDVSKIPAGFYFVKLHIDNDLVVKTITVLN